MIKESNAFRVGVTGGRNIDLLTKAFPARVEAFKAELQLAFENGAHELHHGGCTGVDELAHTMAIEAGVAVVVHPPKDTKHEGKYEGALWVRPRLDYLVRNREIVLESDLLIALPTSRTEVLRSGSWATIRYARTKRAGIPVRIL